MVVNYLRALCDYHKEVTKPEGGFP